MYRPGYTWGRRSLAAAVHLHRFVARRVHPFCIQLFYFLSLSLAGFLLLKAIQAKGTAAAHSPTDLDVFFASVSAATVSSMSVVEMEFFSNAQLVVLTILMLMGAEAFTSMLGLHLRIAELGEGEEKEASRNLAEHGPVSNASDQIELGRTVAPPDLSMHSPIMAANDDKDLKSRAVRCLVLVVLGYIVVVNVMGSSLILLYLNVVPSARDVLRGKDIRLLTFSVFTVVSSFSNCGFVPTNENMIVFRKHSVLLLLVATVILSGNTLYAPLLRSAVWVLGRLTGRPAVPFEYILKHHRKIGYDHLFSTQRCVFLALTVVGFLMVQLVLFCCMEWGSEGLKGMNTYQKLVGALFMSVNSRHAGESVVDISSISSAVLVLYVVMMYLPPHTTFMTVEHDHHEANPVSQKEGRRRTVVVMKSLLFSQLSYLAIFTILICITERKNLSRDPLNFNVLNVVIEVVSAYGNVGFSTGYSCARRLKPESDCSDMWYGFSGRWSHGGKLILICVMLFGRLKGLCLNGGKAWVLN